MDSRASTQSGQGTPDKIRGNRFVDWLNRNAGNVFILPSVLIVLLLSIFPLIISAYLALTRVQFVPGGFDITFVGTRQL